MNKLHIIVFVALGVCGSMHAQNSNPLRDSLAVAQRELDFHPDSVDLILKKASWNMQLNEWQYAKNEYDKVLQMEPTNAAGLYYRAFVNEKLNRFKFARLDYQNLLYLVPGNFEAQLGLALLNQKDKHYTEAFDGINRLVAQFPDSAVAYAARAGIEKERKMYELAEFDFTEAIKRDRTNTDYLINRTDVLLLQGKKEEALADIKYLQTLGVPKASLMDFIRRAQKK